jgi:inner membrane transporter RhtA
MQTAWRPSLPPVPAVLLAVFSVQGGAAIAKTLFPVLGAAGTAGIRVVLSGAILLAAFRPRVRRFTAAQWRVVVPFGVILGVMNLVFYLAISRIPLGLGVTLEFIGPLGVAVAGSRRALDGVWVALAAAGIVLIAPWGREGADSLGVVLALGAGACWAAYIVLGGRVSLMIPGGAAVAVAMSIAAVVILPFAVASGDLARLTPALLAAGAGVALLSSAIPYTLEMIALKALPARTFGILMSLEPAVAALCGLVFLGEMLSASQWLAVMLVIAASAGSALTARAAKVAAEV